MFRSIAESPRVRALTRLVPALLLGLSTALTGCARQGALATPRLPAATAAISAQPTTTETAPQRSLRDPSSPRAYAVVSARDRLFVLLGVSAKPQGESERLALAGGWMLHVSRLGASRAEPFTLVSPTGQCVGTAAREVAVTLDMGGYAGASLPTATERAVELVGCRALAAEDSFVIALAGRDETARWVHPAHLDDAPAPADRRLGENEVWLHRFGLATSELEVVERSVLRYVTPTCSEEQFELIVVDESDRPIAHHADFSLRGAIQGRGAPLLVLVGHDEPQALRVVEADREARVALDARLEVFQDMERPGC